MQKPGTQATTLVNSATNGLNVTATWTTNKANAGGYSSLVAFLNVTAATGTSPSMTVKFQDSPDGTIWVDIPSGAFTAATAVTTGRLVIANVANYVRAVSTITGTTPSFTYDVKIAGNN